MFEIPEILGIALLLFKDCSGPLKGSILFYFWDDRRWIFFRGSRVLFQDGAGALETREKLINL